MRTEVNLTIKRNKTKFVGKLPIEEFKKGKWLNKVPSSEKVVISYNASTGVLYITDTPYYNVIKHEG